MKVIYSILFVFLKVLLFCVSIPSFAQNLVTNGGFENISGPGINCSTPFRTPTGIPGWEQAHGSPQVQMSSGPCNQGDSFSFQSGNNFFFGLFTAIYPPGYPSAGLRTDEGIYQNLTLQGGKAYQVSMKVTTAQFVVEACSGLTPYNGDSTIPIPNIPSNDRQEIFRQAANGLISTTFYPKKTFSQIWIHHDPDYSGPNSATKIDDVIITEVNAINQLSGTSGVVCGSTQFQIPIASTYYNWSIPTGNASIIGSGNTVIVTPTTGSGYITISVAVDNGYTYSVTVYTGPPQLAYIAVNGQPTSYATICVNNFASVEALPFYATASYNWTLNNPGNAYITNYQNASTAFNSYTADCYELGLQISNACGSTYGNLTICAQNCFYRYTVQPNPAKDYITIEFESADKANALPDNIELISEVSKKQVKSVNVQEVFNQKKFKNGKAIELDVRDIPRGTYYLHVLNSRQSRDKQVERMRIILE